MTKTTDVKKEVIDDVTGEVVCAQETYGMKWTPGLGAAMVAVQKAMKPATPSATGYVGKDGSRAYQYATLADVTEVLQGLMTANNLFWTHLPQATDGTCVRMLTYVVHAPSGGWLMSEIVMTPSTPTPQNLGSTMTYARRYGLSAMMGVVVEDDDASAASETPPARAASPGSNAAKTGAGRPAAAAGKPGKSLATHEQLLEIKNLLQAIHGDDADAKRDLYHELADFEAKDGKKVAAPDDTRRLSTGWAANIIKSLKAYQEASGPAEEHVSQDAEGHLEDDSIPF